MSNIKLTAVEWLELEIAISRDGLENSVTLKELIEQAYEIEKEQIKNAFDSGVYSVLKNFDKAYSEIDGEDYYEMFKVMNDILSEKTTKPKDFKF